jgi:integrase/recombinase XerD
MSQKLADTLGIWLDDCILDLRRRGYAQRTQESYRYNLMMFLDWVKARPELTGPGELTTAVLEHYQMHLMLRPSQKTKYRHSRTLGTTTRNLHLCALRAFFKFLKRTCKLLSNPSLELERARMTYRVPKAVLSVPEMVRLLLAVPNETPIGLRDSAAMEVLYGTGVRRAELLDMTLPDLRLSEGLVHVLGKGKRERVVPLGKAAQRALERYLREGRPRLVEGVQSHLWLSDIHGGPVGEKELRDNLKAYARQAGIKKHVSFHVFRHTMATHLLREGADLRVIQTMLGHAQLNTTAIYTRVEVTDLQKTLQRCHPREQDFTSPT